MATINQLLDLETQVQEAVGTLNATIRAATIAGANVSLTLIERHSAVGEFHHVSATVSVAPSRVDLVWKGVGE